MPIAKDLKFSVFFLQLRYCSTLVREQTRMNERQRFDLPVIVRYYRDAKTALPALQLVKRYNNINVANLQTRLPVGDIGG